MPEDCKPIDDNKIKLLENMRIAYRATHENLIYSILSTAWAVERVQYSSLKALKLALINQNISDKFLWQKVLMARFETFELVKDIEPNSSKLARVMGLIPLLKSNIDTIVNNFMTFEDEVTYVLCLENEAGNLEDPTGTLIEINRILRGKVPSVADMIWFENINNKFIRLVY